MNTSPLRMIKTSIQHASGTKQPIYLDPEPKTSYDAVRNLEAFAANSAPRGEQLSGRLDASGPRRED